MSNNATALVWQRARVKGGDLVTLLYLAAKCDQSGITRSSLAQLSVRCREDERTVQTRLIALREAGYLKIEKGGLDSTEGTFRYFIQLDKLAAESDVHNATGPIEDSVLSRAHTPARAPAHVHAPPPAPALYIHTGGNIYSDDNQSIDTRDTEYGGDSGDRGVGKEAEGEERVSPVRAVVPAGGKGRSTGSRAIPSVSKTLAPDEYVVSDQFWDWALGAGWRADREALQADIDTCLAHHKGKGSLHLDWMATMQYWVRRSIVKGDDIQHMRRRGGNALGNREQSRNGYGGYGYERGGRPGDGAFEQRGPRNRAETVRNAYAILAERQAERLARIEADGDGEDMPGERRDLRGFGGR